MTVLDFRFRVFEPWAPKGRILPGYINFSWAGKLNDHSVLTLQVERGSESEVLLEGEKEVSLEVFLNGEWVEPAGCRFRTRSSKVDLVKSASTREFSLLGLSSVLLDALVWNATAGNKDGKRIFAAQSPGKMLGDLLREAKARNDSSLDWAPGLAWTFSDSRDSAGESWGKNASNSFVPTATLFKVLDWLTDKGAVDWRFTGRELQVYKSNGAMSRDRGVPLREAFASAVPVNTTTANLATTALMRGKAGKQWNRSTQGHSSAFGRIEVAIDQGQVELDSTAELHMASRLTRGNQPARQYRREWALPLEGAPVLWLDYQIGDWVSLAGEKMRVVEAGIKVSDNGEITGWETLGRRIDSLIERLARKTTDLSDGAIGGENSPVIAALGPDNEIGQPAKPTGLLVSSDAVPLKDGSHRSVVTISWQPVRQTVNGVPVSIAEYQVRITENGVAVYDLQALEPRLIRNGYPGARWRIQVRALSRQNVWSNWSGVVDHILAEDEEAPPKPESPVLENELGILRISTSGVTDDGGSMPADVAMWEVAVSTSDTENPTVDSTVADAGGLVWYKAGLTPGVTYYVRIRAVDRSGNASPWSDSASGTVDKVFDDTALRAEIRDGTIIGEGAIKTPHLAALSIGSDQLAANAVKAGKVESGALDGFIITGPTIQTNHQVNVGVKLTPKGLFAYDSDGHQSIAITGTGGSIDGYTIRGGILESENLGSKVRIANGQLVITRNGEEKLTLNDKGLIIREGARVIGHIRSIHKVGEPEVKGLSMALNNSGDFVSWDFERNESDDNYTSSLTLDPKGKYYKGQPGIHMSDPLWLKTLRAPSGEVKFGNFTAAGQGPYPALWRRNGGGIIFGDRDLWISTGGYVYNMTELLQKLTRI